MDWKIRAGILILIVVPLSAAAMSTAYWGIRWLPDWWAFVLEAVALAIGFWTARILRQLWNS